MERFPLKSSTPKMSATYQSVYKKGPNSNNGRGFGAGGEEDLVDIAAGLQLSDSATPTNHGTFQLYEHSARNGSGNSNGDSSPNSCIAQYFGDSTGKHLLLEYD